MRINKYLSEAGVCSRRGADELIQQGWVTINGQMANIGANVEPGDEVVVKGKPIEARKETVVLAFNKPRGIVCSRVGQGAKTVEEYIQYPIALQYVGRLDKDSEGLLLLTNDGDLCDAICRSRHGHEKEYMVWVNRPLQEDKLNQLRQGVPILDTVTRPCEIRQLGKQHFSIILTQGLNRQIRRMCECVGYKVTRLKRVRVLNVELETLKVGEHRRLSQDEMRKLKECLVGKSE